MNKVYQNTTSIILLTFISIFISSCLGDIENPIADSEEVITNYLESNNILAEKTSTGLYYSILSEGSGRDATSILPHEISYTLSLLESGQTFANESSYVFLPQNGAFIAGITQGTLLMSEGDKYRLYIPSTLAFGTNSGNINGVSIPSNANLIADVTLNDIRTETEQKQIEINRLNEYLDAIDDIEFDTIDIRPTGVIRAVITKTTGKSPRYNTPITVAYEGSSLKGNVFDSNENATFQLDTTGLIKGWYDAISQMNKGEESLILIPSDRAYGSIGNSPILPYEPIVFRVTLLDF